MSKKREYELQCLLELLSAAVNKELRPEWQQEPDWGALYKLADYHHVGNAVYGMIMGSDDKRLMRWKGNFEERFRYCVIMHEKYRETEKLILKLLERAKVHCLDLEETVVSGCYEKKEHHYPKTIGFLVETGKRDEITEAMARLGLRLKEGKEGETEDAKEMHFSGHSGVSVTCYERLPFTNKKTMKYFSLPPQPFRKKKGHKFVHVQDVDDFYIYYIARLAEKFARGNLELRDMMDLWQYYQLCYEKMDWKTINKELKRLEMERFSDLIVKLAATWFGYFEGFDEDSIILVSMEEYIVSKGVEAREECETILPLVREVADNYARDLRREKRRELMQLWFPEKSYMEAMYPVLEKAGYLLPFCWIARLIGRQLRKVKYFFKRIGGRIHGHFNKITGKLSDTKKKIKEKLTKQKEDENKS